MDKFSARPRIDLRRTPNRLWSYLALVVAVTLAAWLLFANDIAYARARVQTITKDSVPSVVAAQAIRQGLFRMDGDTAANRLRSAQGGKPEYDVAADRATLAKQLVLAASNITYGESESVPIGNLVEGLPRYAEMAATATANDPGRLVAASGFLHRELVKSANDLDKVNRDQLTLAYEDARRGLRVRAVVALVLGAGLLGVLLSIQWRVARLSRRRVNLPLAGAFFLALVAVLSNVGLLLREIETIRAAKLDAFDSIGYLSEAQAATADARAEALYGLTPKGGNAAWARATQELAALAATDDPAEIGRDYTATDKPTFKGLLGNELRNITYEGEIEAATAELRAFGAFQKKLADIRAREDRDGPEVAAAQALAPSGSVDAAYQKADRTVEATKAINVYHFGLNRDEAFAHLAFPSLSLNLLGLGIIVLAYFGIRQRVSEYAP